MSFLKWVNNPMITEESLIKNFSGKYFNDYFNLSEFEFGRYLWEYRRIKNERITEPAESREAAHYIRVIPLGEKNKGLDDLALRIDARKIPFED